MKDLTGASCYTIENSYLSLSFPVKANRLSGFLLCNRLSARRLSVADGSALFLLQCKGLFGGETLRAEDFKIKQVLRRQTGEQQVLSIQFAPVRVRGCRVELTYEVRLLQYDAFARARLIFNCDKGKSDRVFLEYIDFAPFVLAEGSSGWALPKQASSLIGGTPLSLGQPFFIDHCFFGSEFPAAYNTIQNGVACSKRYYGRTLDELTDSTGCFMTDGFVFGAAETPDVSSVRTAFFAYIEKIARPSRPRVQYNTWFEHMLDIDEKTLLQDIADLEKGRNEAGCDALDCVVIDDGWNDYSADFWAFNDKFPNALSNLAAQARFMGGTFGLWIGPRGGYNAQTKSFAKAIEKSGRGYYNKQSRDICVASPVYTEHLAAFMAACQRDFDVSYWKIDGIARASCSNQHHGHPVGGKNDLLYYTGLWETWIRLFDSLNQNSTGPLFLNLTSYALPSPWMLQWVQSVWLQNSSDFDFAKSGKQKRGMDAALTYRAGRYYDFYHTRQFCFPASRLYHHDPIYAAKADLEMTDAAFYTYLFAVTARGSRLTELYLGNSRMTPVKWRICRAAEQFGKQYRRALDHTLLFGGDPLAGELYGFAAFDTAEGLLTVCNPSDAPQSLTLRLDETLGVKRSMQNLPLAQLVPQADTGVFGAFSYGDDLQLSLRGHELQIFHFGALGPVCAQRVRALSDRRVEVFCDQVTDWTGVSCAENPVEHIEPLIGGWSAVLTLRNAFSGETSLTLDGLRNALGEAQTLALRFLAFPDGRITQGGLSGTGGFSIKINFDPLLNKELFRQGGDVSVVIEEDHVVFTVGKARLRSVRDVRDMVQLCAVREDSGVLKLFLNGQPDAGLLPPDGIYPIANANPSAADPARTKLYCRALAYDEV